MNQKPGPWERARADRGRAMTKRVERLTATRGEYWAEENPGIWRLYSRTDNPLLEVRAVSAEGGACFGQLINRVTRGYFKVKTDEGKAIGQKITYDELLANVRLIAAAPELYKMLALLIESGVFNDAASVSPWLRARRTEARALIARIEGGAK